MNGPLTAQEAAHELGYHINYLYRLLKQGTVKAQQFNRVWMIDRQEVERIKALQGKGVGCPRHLNNPSFC
jgi:excisionase family DNA binding protein